MQRSDPHVTSITITTFDVNLHKAVLSGEIMEEDKFSSGFPGNSQLLNFLEVVLAVAHTDGQVLGHVTVVRGADRYTQFPHHHSRKHVDSAI